MAGTLRLTVTDYRNAGHWRWVLEDERGRFVADHSVKLDRRHREYRGFLDLSQYLDYYHDAYSPEQQLAELGVWIGTHSFGVLTGRPARAVYATGHGRACGRAQGRRGAAPPSVRAGSLQRR